MLANPKGLSIQRWSNGLIEEGKGGARSHITTAIFQRGAEMINCNRARISDRNSEGSKTSKNKKKKRENGA